MSEYLDEHTLKSLRNNYGTCNTCGIAMFGSDPIEQAYPTGKVICKTCRTTKEIENIKKEIRRIEDGRTNKTTD